MRSVLNLDETLTVLDPYFRTTSKVRSELPAEIHMENIPILKYFSLAEGIHIKTRELSQNTDLTLIFDMREFSGIAKAL